MNFEGVINNIKSVYGNQEFSPLAVPVFAGNEKKYLEECIDTTFVSSVGKFVDRFEDDMANRCQEPVPCHLLPSRGVCCENRCFQ